MTRIYTRTGDRGTTGLVGGGRVSKDDLRVEAYGTIDECSSALGVACAVLRSATMSDRAQTLERWLSWLQDVLFNIGSSLATPGEKRREETPGVTQTEIDFLEHAIDRCQRDLPPLTQFIHPGGSFAGGSLHLARTVCRRAERRVVELQRREEVAPATVMFLNRLSDALFVWARWVNHELGDVERIWNKQPEQPQIPA